jgi:hypothetical protein
MIDDYDEYLAKAKELILEKDRNATIYKDKKYVADIIGNNMKKSIQDMTI